MNTDKIEKLSSNIQYASAISIPIIFILCPDYTWWIVVTSSMYILTDFVLSDSRFDDVNGHPGFFITAWLTYSISMTTIVVAHIIAIKGIINAAF